MCGSKRTREVTNVGKRLKSILIVTIFAVICAGLFYRQAYPIKLNFAVLDQQVGEHLKYGKEPAPEVKVLGEGVTLHGKEYYLIRVNGQFGQVSMERGPFGGHRIIDVSYGNAEFTDEIIEIDGKKYLLFSGMDYGGYIKKITVEIQHVTYDLFPGKSRPFLTYCEVNDNVTDYHVNLEHIQFYDENGTDITSSYKLGGGSNTSIF